MASLDVGYAYPKAIFSDTSLSSSLAFFALFLPAISILLSLSISLFLWYLISSLSFFALSISSSSLVFLFPPALSWSFLTSELNLEMELAIKPAFSLRASVAASLICYSFFRAICCLIASWILFLCSISFRAWLSAT